MVWRELHFAAHKLGLSATVDVRIDTGGLASPSTPEGMPAIPGQSAASDVLIESTSHLPGRTFLTQERVEPLEAGAKVIVNTEIGAKNHTKTYSLGRRGFLLDLVEPASRAEAALPPSRWTRGSRTFTAYPRALPGGAAITGPAGLLYAVSAADLSSPGDSLEIYVLVQTQVELVTVRVEGVETVPVAFRAESGGAGSDAREKVPALRLVARSRPLDPAAASAFRLFGLEGDVEILWDSVRRIPVELSGNVKLLGHLEVRLVSATLRTTPAT